MAAANQPPIDFSNVFRPQPTDFITPLLQAARFKQAQESFKTLEFFRKKRTEQEDIRLGFERRRVEALEAKAARPESLFQKPQIEDFTPESIERFRITKNPSELVPREKKESTLFQKPVIQKFTAKSIERFRITKNPADLVPREKEGSTLETARGAFLEGRASPEQLALINQDKAEYIKDYLSVFQGTILTPRKHANLRGQGEILFQIERLKANPLPSNITSASQAVKHLVSLGFDENQAREIVKQIMRNERAPQR